MCILMHLKKLCEGSPQFQANPTLAGRDLSKMLPLTIHGDGTPVCGAGKSWSKMGDFFSWSCMLVTSGHSQLTRFLIFMVHAYMRCPNLMWCRSNDSVCDVFLMSFVTSNTMFLSLLLHVSVLLFFISGARSLDETRWDVSSTWWRGVLLPSMKASGRRSIGLALPSITRKGWARHGVNFVLGLQSDEPYES